MSLQIGPFCLSDKFLKKMKDQLNETSKIHLEHGFNICESSGELLSGNKYVGEREDIAIPSLCTTGKHVGAYHTHPDDFSRITSADMIQGCISKIECVGGLSDNKINCFLRNNSDSNTCKNDATLYYKNIESPLEKFGKFDEKYKEDVEKYEEGLRQLINKYFEKFAID